MLTPSAGFEANRVRAGVESGWVISFTDNTSTWYYSERHRNLSADIFCLPFLKGHSGIKTDFDIIGRGWSVGNVDVTISNHQYDVDATGAPEYIDEKVATWVGKTATISKLKGEDDVDNVLLEVYRGFVTDAKRVRRDTVVITIQNRAAFMNEVVPQRTLHSVYPQDDVTPNSSLMGSKDTVNKRTLLAKGIPIVYGTYNGSEPWLVDGLGMATVVAIAPHRTGSKPKFLVADHPVGSIDEMWFRQGAVDATDFCHGVQWFKTITEDINEQGPDTVYRGVVTPGDVAYLRLRPASWIPGDIIQDPQDPAYDSNDPPSYKKLYTYAYDGVTPKFQLTAPDNFNNVFDGDDATYAVGNDNSDRTSPNNRMINWFPFVFPSLDSSNAVGFQNKIGKMVGDCTFGILSAAAAPGSITTAVVKYAWAVRDATEGYRTDDTKTVIADGILETGTTPSWATGTLSQTTNLGDGYTPLFINREYGWQLGQAQGISRPQFPLLFYVVTTCNAGGYEANADDVLNNTPLIHVNDAYLQLQYEPVDISEFFVKCTGKAFGAWIDTDGRTTDSDEGDLIGR